MGAKIKMPFVATGRLVEYVTKDDVKVKGFYLETATDTHYIKLSKLLRQVMPATIAPGTAIEVKGEQC
ncbi:MAG: (2Fe-2S) ferredoxin domain-containing protein, partial [Cyanobacteria bacterium J06639_1]